MFSISKRYTFSAAHHLLGLPDGHPCSRVHGHNYTVEVECGNVGLDERGFVLDYNDLDRFVKPIIAELDHQSLNDFLPQPSAEELARHIYQRLRHDMLPTLRAVRVSETDKTNAEYRP